eukprot:COSAG01_NODE_4040_length_5410_cov_55.452834_3_plen_105_part_00
MKGQVLYARSLSAVSVPPSSRLRDARRLRCADRVLVAGNLADTRAGRDPATAVAVLDLVDGVTLKAATAAAAFVWCWGAVRVVDRLCLLLTRVGRGGGLILIGV